MVVYAGLKTTYEKKNTGCITCNHIFSAWVLSFFHIYIFMPHFWHPLHRRAANRCQQEGNWKPSGVLITAILIFSLPLTTVSTCSRYSTRWSWSGTKICVITIIYHHLIILKVKTVAHTSCQVCVNLKRARRSCPCPTQTRRLNLSKRWCEMNHRLLYPAL